jgi:selenocysteine lyase/cysteine desulfurase
VTEAAAFARSLGVPTLVDGAQALGVFPVDLEAIDADFYAGSAHKWLMGPAGVGFLIVAARRMPEYNPNAMPLDGAGKPITAGTRSELGTANQVLRMGAAHSLGLLQSIGFDRIEERARSLTGRLRQGLRAMPGVVNAGTDDWPCSSGITTLQFDGHTEARCRAVVELLRDDHRIVTKYRPERCGIRVSVAAFNSEEEIDRLLNALEHVIRRS